MSVLITFICLWKVPPSFLVRILLPKYMYYNQNTLPHKTRVSIVILSLQKQIVIKYRQQQNVCGRVIFLTNKEALQEQQLSFVSFFYIRTRCCSDLPTLNTKRKVIVEIISQNFFCKRKCVFYYVVVVVSITPFV